jgi:hypothetical protein
MPVNSRQRWAAVRLEVSEARAEEAQEAVVARSEL